MAKNIFIVFVFLCLSVVSSARKLAAQNLQILRNVDAGLTPAQLETQPGWKNIDPRRALNLGFSADGIWLRWQQHNDSEQSRERVLQINYELLQSVQLYMRSRAAADVPAAWRQVPAMPRTRKPAFAFAEPPGLGEYLLHVRSNSPMIIDLDLFRARDWPRAQRLERHLLVMLLIFIYSLSLYNLMLFVLHRRGSYLLYSVAVALLATFLLVHGGFLARLWPGRRFDLMHIVSVLALAGNLAMILFAHAFLRRSQRSTRLVQLLRWAAYISFALIAVMSLFYLYWFAPVVSLWTVLVGILLLLAGLDSWRHGFVPARLFAVTWLLFLVAIVSSLLKAMGWMAVNSFTTWAYQIAFGLEALVLSLALEDRMVRDNRHLDKLNSQLEDKVAARTEALNIAAQKMRAHSQELEREIADRKEVQEQLLHSQKMESLGRLAGGIAHDMNNVLGAILGFAALLRQDSPDDSLQAQDLDDIITATRRGRDLTGKLLGFARKGVFRKELVDLQQLLAEDVEFLRHSLEKNIEIQLHLAEKLPPCLGDPDQINLAVINLCTNAAEAMPAGGRIDIYTEFLDADDEDVAKNIKTAQGKTRPTKAAKDQPAGWIRLRVADQGHGLSKEAQARAFEPFYSSKRGKGSGLGLAMVYGVAESHGGYARLDCEQDQGCVASFVIRAEAEQQDTTGTEALLPAAASAVSPSGRDLYVLLADDERGMRNVGQRMLESLGCQVVLAQDGDEALRIFRREPQRYDLVVLDVRMPKLDGVEAYLQMRASRADICSLVTSGYSQDERLNEMVQDPCCVFLAKPFDLDGLEKALKKLPLRARHSDNSTSA